MSRETFDQVVDGNWSRRNRSEKDEENSQRKYHVMQVVLEGSTKDTETDRGADECREQ